MALAQGILLWLPLEWLLRLRRAGSSLVSAELLSQRLQVVNRLPPEYLQESAKWPGDLWTRYLRLCTYQGEFSTEAINFLSANALAARAAALRSVDWYRFYSDHDATIGGQPEALKSGEPAIQAQLLARYSDGTYALPQILDPRAWPWTRGLARVLPPLIERRNDLKSLSLAGYLQHDEKKTNDPTYLTSALAYYMLRSPDPFVLNPGLGLQKRSKDVIDRYWAGDYSWKKPEVAAAFRYLDVRAVQIALRKYPEELPSIIDRTFFVTHISEYLCRRAYAMYLLAKSNPGLPFSPKYLLRLRALAGLPLSEDLQTAGLKGGELWEIEQIMVTVAHPDLRSIPTDYDGDPVTPDPSEVKYDVSNFLRITANVPKSLTDYNIDDLFRRLYVQGQALAHRDDERLRENFSPRNNYSGGPRMAPGAAEVRRIYDILLAEQEPL